MLTIFSGCSESRTPVSGEVTLNGQPFDGSISFEPADHQGPTTGGKITAGKYELVGDAAPLPGKKVVRISGGLKTGRKIPASEFSPPGTMIDEIGLRVPAIYNSRSTLTCELTSGGTGKLDFKLDSK